MSELRFTQHAQARMQQRAIPSRIVEILYAFGRREHDHRGGSVLYFDKPSRRRLARGLPELSQGAIDRYLDAYAVVTEAGEVITVGHRDKRIKRH